MIGALERARLARYLNVARLFILCGRDRLACELDEFSRFSSFPPVSPLDNCNMAGEQMQTIKVAMILCSCFFAYGVCKTIVCRWCADWSSFCLKTYWSDWAFDYFLLWANPAEHPNAVSRAAVRNRKRTYGDKWLTCFLSRSFTTRHRHKLPISSSISRWQTSWSPP